MKKIPYLNEIKQNDQLIFTFFHLLEGDMFTKLLINATFKNKTSEKCYFLFTTLCLALLQCSVGVQNSLTISLRKTGPLSLTIRPSRLIVWYQEIVLFQKDKALCSAALLYILMAHEKFISLARQQLLLSSFHSSYITKRAPIYLSKKSQIHQ